MKSIFALASILQLFFVQVVYSSSSSSSTLVSSYSATVSTCPSPFTRVSNGCYFFVVGSPTDWSSALSACKYPPQPGLVYSFHLIAFESNAEVVAVSYWLRGTPAYLTNFWIGANLNSEGSLYWEWLNKPYTAWGYWAYSFANVGPAYISYNGSNYEVHNNLSTSTPMNYICEAQVYCQPSDNQCLNNGTCVVNSARVMCICATGYEGIICETQTDNCLNAPCQNNGECINNVGSYTCKCQSWWSGSNCENYIAWEFEWGRTAVLDLWCGIVGLLLLLLAIMDLPWARFFKAIDPKKIKSTPKKQMSMTNSEDDVANGKNANKLNNNSMLNSEEEMLRKFKSAINQTQQRKGRITPLN